MKSSKPIPEPLNTFFQRYPDIRQMEVDSKTNPNYKARLYLIGSSDGRIMFAVRDKDDESGKFNVLTEEPEMMRFFGKFFSQGVTFKYLLQSKIVVPREMK
jgi:hypothetical protein